MGERSTSTAVCVLTSRDLLNKEYGATALRPCADREVTRDAQMSPTLLLFYLLSQWKRSAALSAIIFAIANELVAPKRRQRQRQQERRSVERKSWGQHRNGFSVRIQCSNGFSVGAAPGLEAGS